jgi:TPR repeat protein
MTKKEIYTLRDHIAVGVQAMVDLGKHHLEATEWDQAVFYLSRATAFDHPEAKLILGHFYLQLDHTIEGFEGENTQKTGIGLLTEASEGGIEQATELLKTAWARGVCVQQIEAFFCRVAERQGSYAEEQNDAAAMLQAAFGLQCFGASSATNATSYELLKKAALLGNEEASEALKELGKGQQSIH